MLRDRPRAICSRSIVRFALASLVIAACAPSRPSPDTWPAVNSSVVTTILRERSFEDSDLASRGRGRLEVVVRSTDRPTQVLPEALVLVRLNAGDTLRRMTDHQGLALFDSLPVGNHDILVRRLGYGGVRAVVAIKPGCRTDAEAYIAISMMGIAPPPPMVGRVTLTTCE